MQIKPQRHGGTEKQIFHNKELTDKIIASAIEVHPISQGRIDYKFLY